MNCMDRPNNVDEALQFLFDKRATIQFTEQTSLFTDYVSVYFEYEEDGTKWNHSLVVNPAWRNEIGFVLTRLTREAVEAKSHAQ